MWTHCSAALAPGTEAVAAALCGCVCVPLVLLLLPLLVVDESGGRNLQALPWIWPGGSRGREQVGREEPLEVWGLALCCRCCCLLPTRLPCLPQSYACVCCALLLASSSAKRVCWAGCPLNIVWFVYVLLLLLLLRAQVQPQH